FAFELFIAALIGVPSGREPLGPLADVGVGLSGQLDEVVDDVGCRAAALGPLTNQGSGRAPLTRLDLRQLPLGNADRRGQIRPVQLGSCAELAQASSQV